MSKVRQVHPVSKVSTLSGRTLGRNCTTAVPDQEVVQLGRCNTVLSVNMEEAHVSSIHDKEGGVYDLTTVDVVHLAYEITEKQNINHCFTKGTNMAEVDLKKENGNTLMECSSSTINGSRHWLWVDECRDIGDLDETFTNTTKAYKDCE